MSTIDPEHLRQGNSLMERLLDIRRELKSLDLNLTSIDDVRKKVRQLVLHAGYEPIANGGMPHRIWFRAQKCDDEAGFGNLHRMIYNDAPRAFGRANIIGRPVHYAGWSPANALSEIDARPGDYIQLIHTRPIEGAQIPGHLIGDFAYINQAHRSMTGPNDALVRWIDDLQRRDQFRYMANVFVDSFIAEQFRQYVPNAEEHMHKLTAAYAELLHPGNGAILYPSVKMYSALNIAVPAATFDQQFEVLATHVCQVMHHYDYGLFLCLGKRSSFDFEPDGSIAWDSDKKIPLTSEGHIVPGHLGWRKAPPADAA